jgi:hypothetical protein
MAKKKRTPRAGQIREIGPFKTWEEIEVEANKALKELGNIDILSTVPISAPKIGNFLVITYKPNRRHVKEPTVVEPLKLENKWGVVF